MPLQPTLDALQHALEHTRLSAWMVHSDYAWATCESLHFLGLTLLVGTVGLFDLRLLGFGRGLSPAAMHRLTGWGIFGFCLNVVTGAMFFAGFPYNYLYNSAFQAKMVCLALLGLNVALFRWTSYAKVLALGPDDDAPFGAKAAGAVSLVLWVAVICFGRAEAFFKP